jgi:succinyl-diaminopimelate desuccinylase
MKEQIIDLTRRLVEIPSVTGDEWECQRIIEMAVEMIGPRAMRREFVRTNTKGESVRSVLWGDENTMMEPRLLLAGHIDVVAAAANQFDAKIVGDRLYGRGAGDMKGFDAAMLVAYGKWIDEGGPRGVGLLLTSDEEVGGFDGARYVVEKEGLRPDVVFIPDGEFDFDIVESQKAPHHFHIQADGVGGHASRAYRIDNPLNRVIKLYQAMRTKYSLATLQNDWQSTFEMTVLETKNGSANKIPAEVEAWFSWRWPLEQFGFAEGVADMNRLAKEFDCQILPDGHGGGEGCLTQRTDTCVMTWKGIIEKQLRREVGYTNMHGATDGRHFYKYGARVLVTSGLSGGAHAIDEWVDLPSLVDLAEAIGIYAKELK